MGLLALAPCAAVRTVGSDGFLRSTDLQMMMVMMIVVSSRRACVGALAIEMIRAFSTNVSMDTRFNNGA